MKREVRPFILCLLLGLLTILVGGLNMGVQAQQNAGGAQNQKRLTGLVVDWMNDFEDCEDWRALSTCPLGDTKIRKIEGRPVSVNENGETQDVQIQLTDENE